MKFDRNFLRLLFKKKKKEELLSSELNQSAEEPIAHMDFAFFSAFLCWFDWTKRKKNQIDLLCGRVVPSQCTIARIECRFSPCCANSEIWKFETKSITKKELFNWMSEFFCFVVSGKTCRRLLASTNEQKNKRPAENERARCARKKFIRTKIYCSMKRTDDWNIFWRKL